MALTYMLDAYNGESTEELADVRFDGPDFCRNHRRCSDGLDVRPKHVQHYLCLCSKLFKG